MRQLILAIDQGSSATKCAVLDPRSGAVRVEARAPVRVFTPQGILASVRQALTMAVRRLPSSENLSFIVAIANQRSTLVFLNDKGLPDRTIIPWWDPSGVDPAAHSEEDRRWFQTRTGLPLLPNWWAGKLGRIVRDLGPTRSIGRPATVDTMLLAWLTSGQTYATDLSNAARTGLVDIQTGRRTKALRNFFGIPLDVELAEIRESLDDFGELRFLRPQAGPATRRNPPRLRGRVGAVVGDAGAGLMGMTGGEDGVMTLTLGSGGFLHLPCRRGTTASEGLYRAPAWRMRGRTRWALEAAIPGMARALEAGLAAADLPPNAPSILVPRIPSRSIEAVLAPDGLGAIGPEGLRGIHLEGVWNRATSEERLGAILDGLALLVARAVACFPARPRLLVASGGVSRSSYLLARIADFTGLEVGVAASTNAPLRGAAMMAALSAGHRIPPLGIQGVVVPRLGEQERRSTLARFERRLDSLNG